VFVFLALAMAAVMFVLYVGIAFYIFSSHDNTVDAIDFDSQTWKNTPAESSFDSVRLRMVDSLLDLGILNGKSRSEIIELLGEPDDSRSFSDYDLVWYLGPERGFLSIDSEWLWVDLDENGVAVEVRLGHD